MLPTLFLSHGAPMTALTDTPARDFLIGLGGLFARPKAILVASAHWETELPMLNAVSYTHLDVYKRQRSPRTGHVSHFH